MILSDLAIRNRTTVAVMTFLIVLGGVYCYVTLPREAAPDVPIPIILISTTYEGISPQDVESSVTMKIEKELTGLKGVKEIRSSSAEGRSLVVLEFMPDILVEDAIQYVRNKLDQAKSELPESAEEPVLSEINIAEFPIMFINITGPISPVSLKLIADQLEDAIEVVPGVLNVEVSGALEREIRIEVDQDSLTAYRLTIPELLRLIPSENVNISAGGLETPGTRFNVRVPAEFGEPQEIEHLLLTVRDGKPIYLPDVAVVRDTFKDRQSFSRLDGSPTITLSVQKRVGANILAMSDTIKAILDQARRQAPQAVRFDVTMDQSDDIRRSVLDLENNVISGALLVLVVLMLFMGLRVASVVALAIPTSMLLGLICITAFGFTLNMIVLFSLILSVGMLVDNAIVIVENIYRHMQLGYSRLEAAKLGTTEVAWPVITSTLTTVVAFMPLVFWPGIVGDFMKYLPVTVMFMLMSSLFVALVISPTASSLVAGGRARELKHGHWFLNGYRRFLSAAMRKWNVTLSLALGLLVALIVLYRFFGKGVEFFPKIDPRQAVVSIRAPQGTHIDQTDKLAREIEQRAQPYQQSLKHMVTNVGSAGDMDPHSSLAGGSAAGPHVGSITLMFPDFEVRKTPSAQIIAAIRSRTADVVGAELKIARQEMGPPTGEDVEIQIIGPDFKQLGQLSEQARQMVADVPNLMDVRSDLESARPELAFRVDRRRAMLLGVNTITVGNFLKTAVFGSKVGTYRQFKDEYDITVRLPPYQRQNIEDLLRLQVPNEFGLSVPMSSLGRFVYTGGFGTINRINQKRVVRITGSVEGRLASDVLEDVRARLGGFGLPAGYEIRFAGQKEEQDEAVAFLSKAFVAACFLIVMVLVAEFNTLTVPLIIMTTVGLSMVGVLAGLIITRMPFGVIMSGIGVISLAGVVVNNAIVLLAYTRQLQRAGKGLIEACIEAGITRLRPVLLTAATTIIALVPMAVGVSYDFRTFELVTRSESSEWWRGMAVAVIFGLGFATLLTLVVVPTLYYLVYHQAERLGLGGLARPGEDLPPPSKT